MKFFVPAAKDEAQAETVYQSIAQFVGGPLAGRKIWKLAWRHNGMDMSCEVGHSLPSYYQTGEEPVLAIFDCGSLYKICTPNRGGLRGEAVLAGKSFCSSVICFDEIG